MILRNRRNMASLMLVMMPMMVNTKMMMSLGKDKTVMKKDLKSRPSRDLDNFINTDTPSPSLPPGMTLPADIPEGFDLSTVEPGDDGQFCVFKKLTLEGIEKIPVQQCVHKVRYH